MSQLSSSEQHRFHKASTFTTASPPPIHRLIVVEQVYHQQAGDEPTSLTTRFVRKLTSDEQSYTRQCRVRRDNPDWIPLEYGWISDVGMLVISNDEGKNQQRIPDAEQKRRIAGRIIVLGIRLEIAGAEVVTTFARILPGESIRFSPVGSISLRFLRENDESGEDIYYRYSLTAIPA